MKTIPVSLVIPTRDRPAALTRMIESVLVSTRVPDEVVIVDASADRNAMAGVMSLFQKVADGPRVIVQTAIEAGAAAQRNQAALLANNEFILFCDDDIICEPECIERLWNALRSDAGIGGASAAIVNQSYARPGRLMRVILRVSGGPEGTGYAGRIVGPVIPFLPFLPSLPSLPAVGVAVPDTVPVQWLNLGCTLYRRHLLPDPPFDAFFRGYSIGEDIALSLRVAKKARLVNVPAARIYHDSQPGRHKARAVTLGRMETVNRAYIMVTVMDKRSWRDAARLLLWEGCQLAVCAWQQRGGIVFWQRAWGKLLGLNDIVHLRRAWDRR